MLNRLRSSLTAAALAALLLAVVAPSAPAAQCGNCHSGEFNAWAVSPHASTQADPAAELGLMHSGQSPADVIASEDCITCHSPTAGANNGGMTDAQALGYFYTTSNGVFTADTAPTNTSAWPHVSCTACHFVASPHEFIAATLALFESRTGQYVPMGDSSRLCGQCHGDLRFPGSDHQLYNHWSASRHSQTQTNVASQLAQLWAGRTPADVIYGTNADNCIACHSPTAVNVRGGDEALALANFFTTSNGYFTTNTAPANEAQWPGIACVACHDPHSPGQPAYFNSSTKSYQAMATSSQLCGQCHGDLRFPGSDQQLYNAWAGTRHATSQADVAAGLSKNQAGKTPDAVINGPGSMNCVACHSPTSVRVTGGDEAATLGYFFTTTNGLFATNTAVAHAGEWPGVACDACHDPHAPDQLAYFNSTTRGYDVMTNSTQLCGQCHGNLHFPNPPYLSYNILTGTGGAGVPDEQLMGGVSCTDCHMHASDVPGSNSKKTAGHSWAITLAEPGGEATVSCLWCHDTATPEAAWLVIRSWQAEFQALAVTVSSNVTRVATAVAGSSSPAAQAALAAAQYNLAFAQADESGGFHNHPYLMSLLRAADQQASSILLLSAARQGDKIVISWIGAGTLQAAEALSGPWSDVSGAANPMVVGAGATVSPRFYRLRR